MDPKNLSRGERVALIRRDRGDGRYPESLEAFAARVKALDTKGRKWDPSAISKIERGVQEMLIDDPILFAEVDPKGRGPCWVAYGIMVPASGPLDETSGDLSERPASARASVGQPVD